MFEAGACDFVCVSICVQLLLNEMTFDLDVCMFFFHFYLGQGDRSEFKSSFFVE